MNWSFLMSIFRKPAKPTSPVRPTPKPPVSTAPVPKPAPAPQPSPPAPVPTPAATPTPPTPAPAPAPSPADPRYLDRSLLKTPLLDCVFARDGLKLGSPWVTRRQYGAMNDDPAGLGYDNRASYNGSAMAWYVDKDVSPEMDPFRIAPDGLHIAIREFTAEQKARIYPTVQEIQREGFWSGNILAYNLIDVAVGAYVSVKAKTCGIVGEWPAVCLYNQDKWDHEIDVMEQVYGIGSAPSYHRWGSSPQIHDTPNTWPTADGSPMPNSDAAFVDFGCLVTPGRVRWYRNKVLIRDLACPVDGKLYLQILNQAMSAQPWGAVGPLAVSDCPRADLVVESVRIWAV